jgi:hypothetical protein
VKYGIVAARIVLLVVAAFLIQKVPATKDGVTIAYAIGFVLGVLIEFSLWLEWKGIK